MFYTHSNLMLGVCANKRTTTRTTTKRRIVIPLRSESKLLEADEDEAARMIVHPKCLLIASGSSSYWSLKWIACIGDLSVTQLNHKWTLQVATRCQETTERYRTRERNPFWVESTLNLSNSKPTHKPPSKLSNQNAAKNVIHLMLIALFASHLLGSRWSN